MEFMRWTSVPFSMVAMSLPPPLPAKQVVAPVAAKACPSRRCFSEARKIMALVLVRKIVSRVAPVVESKAVAGDTPMACAHWRRRSR